MSETKLTKTYGAAGGYFKKGGWFYSLLTVLIIALVVFCNYTFSLLGAILEDKNLFIFSVATIGYVVLIGTYYVFFSPKIKSTFYAFCIGVGLMISGALFPLYVVLALDVFTNLRIIIASGLFVLGLVYVVVSCLLKKDESKERNGYYVSALKKFSFVGVFGLAIFISCVYYLLTNELFLSAIRISSNGAKPVLLLTYIFLALAFITMVVTVSSKRIEVLDLFLLSTALAIPEIVLNVIFLNNAASDQIVFASVAGGATLILLIVREFVFFDKNTVGKEPVNARYFKAYLSKNSFLAAITVGVGAFLVAFTFFSASYVVHIIKAIEGKAFFNPFLVPIIFIVLSTAALVSIGFIVSILTLNAKRISFGDFFNIVCIALSAAAIPYMFIFLSILWLKIAVCAFVTVSIVIFISRIRSVKY